MKFRVPGKDTLYMMVFIRETCVVPYADGVAMQPASMHVK